MCIKCEQKLKYKKGNKFTSYIPLHGHSTYSQGDGVTKIEDISFGRFPDGSPQWINMSPTPGSSNIQGLSTMNNIMIPTKYFLYPNYPNPFNPVTRFTYDLPIQSQVKISIFNTLGHEIKTLINRKQNNGSYSIQWDCSDNHGNRVSSGVYLYHLNANSFNQTRRMILLK